MKKLILLIAITANAFYISAQDFKIITTIESVVPGGLGRSRMIETDESGNTKEIKMENFFSMVGINFKNITNNDQMIAEMLKKMTIDGWEVVSITPGVYAADKSTGIFIIRYIFKRDTGNKEE